MPVDYMDESDEAASPQAAPRGEAPHEDEGERTAVIDKTIFPEPPQPGDVCQFRVMAVHDDEVELAYAHDEGGEGGEGEGEAPAGEADPMEAMMD